ncbi:hypothetical protein B7486_29990 [cyanobacterium TDX16]|nr:hypothetical protein B7486_29990 [cyanobacterium TDX16]
MLKVKISILQYINYINDGEYLAELFDIINELLRSDDFETFDLTCLFIRDLVLIGNRHETCQEFIENYPDSSVVKTSEHLLFDTNYFTCKQAIYTLGKTCSYNSVNAMTQAFNTFRDTNPILLPRLVGEMG